MLTWSDRLAIAAAHLALELQERPAVVAVMQFRGHLSHYTKFMPRSAAFRREVVTIDDPDEVFARLDRFAEEMRDVPLTEMECAA